MHLCVCLQVRVDDPSAPREHELDLVTGSEAVLVGDAPGNGDLKLARDLCHSLTLAGNSSLVILGAALAHSRTMTRIRIAAAWWMVERELRVHVAVVTSPPPPSRYDPIDPATIETLAIPGQPYDGRARAAALLERIRSA